MGPLSQFGMAAVALGVALFARAVDLPAITSRALAAAWLALVCHLICRTLLRICADAVERGAGTRQLGLLGGLIHRMPVTASCSLAGLFTTAMLPPGLGFAVIWLLFQSLIAVARTGGLALQLLVLAAAAVVALSVGLNALAAVRLFGVVFLGRPRGPRVAVAEEMQRPVRTVLVGLAASLALFGLLPALALLPAAGWIRAASDQWLALGTGAEAPGYSPIAVAALLAMVVFAVSRALRRPGEQRREPAWSGGFVAPAWLPFGDPATQSGPDTFAEPVRRLLALLPSMAELHSRLVGWRDAVMRVAAALVA